MIKELSSVALLALSTACGSQVTVEAETTEDVRLELSLSEASFVVCNCHHGFGPGVDGEVRFEATNPDSRPRTLAIASVAMHRVTEPTDVVFSMVHLGDGWLEDTDMPGANGSYVDFFTMDQGADIARGTVEIAPGLTANVRATFYLDLLALPPESDDYAVEVGFDSGDTFVVEDVVTSYVEPF